MSYIRPIHANQLLIGIRVQHVYNKVPITECSGFGYKFFIMYAGPKVMMIMTSALWNIVMEYMFRIS